MADERAWAQPHRHVSLARRIRLVLEVLRDYGPAHRHVRRNDLEAMVAAARSLRPAAAPPPTGADHEHALLLGRATTRTLALLPTDRRCLVRSLVVLRLMSRRGLPGTLVIGVRPGERLQAHAWVEHAGRPVVAQGAYERLLEA